MVEQTSVALLGDHSSQQATIMTHPLMNMVRYFLLLVIYSAIFLANSKYLNISACCAIDADLSVPSFLYTHFWMDFQVCQGFQNGPT